MSFLNDSRNKTVKKKVNRKTLTGLEKQSLCIKAQKHPNLTLDAFLINQLLSIMIVLCFCILLKIVIVDTAFLSNLKKLKRTIETKQQNIYSKRVFLHFIINKVYIW